MGRGVEKEEGKNGKEEMQRRRESEGKIGGREKEKRREEGRRDGWREMKKKKKNENNFNFTLISQ